MELVPFRHWIIARAGDDHPALRFEDRSWSYRELVAACAQRAAFLLATRREGPLHIGVLLENVPDFPFWIGAAALAGGVVVGINPTRRGAELARDIRHTDCQLIVTEACHRPLLDGLELGLPAERILDVDSPSYAAALAPHAGAAIPNARVAMSDTLLLLFTSGTSGAPKAVICSQGKWSLISQTIVATCGLARDTISYQVMPLFHSNALFTGTGPTLVAGGTAVLRRRFSASGALPDIRKYGCNYFNYVGKPLSYILAQPERGDDSDNPLRVAFGNEAADLDIERFDPADFDAFLAEQTDLGTKWSPRYVRTSASLPITQTSKVQKRQLRAERWECHETVYFRPASGPLRRLLPDDVAALRRRFAERGRESQLR